MKGRALHISGRSQGKFVIGGMLAALVISMLIGINHTDQAEAASIQTRVLNFNVCDQVGSTNPGVDPRCANNSSSVRASAIVTSINSQSSTIVTLQEVCRVTYERIIAGLGPAWTGSFLWTAAISSARCEGSMEWGLAILSNWGAPTDVNQTLLPNSPNSEPRYLFCGTIVVGGPIRQCVTHFTYESFRVSQAIEVGRQMKEYAYGGGAILLGGDLNINSRSCAEAAEVRPIYIRRFGGDGTSTCQIGYGVGQEVDQRHIGGDGTYNAATFGSAKIDYIFFSFPRWLADYDGRATDSQVSDHRILRGEGTLR
jgi:endonuclease/exonuclease/phosphatase family metal-dependent hydrolase